MKSGHFLSDQHQDTLSNQNAFIMSRKFTMLRYIGMLYCICLVQSFFFTNLTEHDWPRYGKRVQSLEKRIYKQRLGHKEYIGDNSNYIGNTERFSYIQKPKMRALDNDESDTRLTGRLTGDDMQHLRYFIQTLGFNFTNQKKSIELFYYTD